MKAFLCVVPRAGYGIDMWSKLVQIVVERDAWPSHSAITWAIASIRSFPLPISRLTCIKRAATEPNALKWYLILPFVFTWPWRIDSGRFLKAKPNWATKRLEIWEQWSEFLHRRRVLELTGARKWDVVSSVRCSIGGPYWCSRMSISCTMDLKSDVGIRERRRPNVEISFIFRSGLSPTKGAMLWYCTLEKLRLFSKK